MPSLLVAHSNLTVFSLLTVIIAFGMRAAFMPVFASSAIGRAPRGLYRTVFTGFGDSLWNNMFVLLFVAAVPAAAVATLDVAVEQFSVIGLLASELPDLVLGTVSGEEISINLGSLVVVIGAALLSLWLFCLQCASAALSFEAASGKGLAQQKRTVAEPKEDIGALLRERMARNQLGG